MLGAASGVVVPGIGLQWRGQDNSKRFTHAISSDPLELSYPLYSEAFPIQNSVFLPLAKITNILYNNLKYKT